MFFDTHLQTIIVNYLIHITSFTPKSFQEGSKTIGTNFIVIDFIFRYIAIIQSKFRSDM